ncbi:MAG: hypothetical protein Q8Q12_00550 [bacterium]|nr:hypothetical protein [bacterium]
MKSLEPRTVWTVASEEGVSAVLGELETWVEQQTRNKEWRNIIIQLGTCRMLIEPFEKTLRELQKKGVRT